MNHFEQLKFGAHGLIPAIVQDIATGEVVMMAYMNEESLQKNIGNRRNLVLQPKPSESLAKRGNIGTYSKSP